MRMEGKLTGYNIARRLKKHQITVSLHLIRVKFFLQRDIKDRDEDPPRCHKYEVPKEMIHLDIKKLLNFNEEGVKDSSTSNLHKSANKVAGSQCMHLTNDDRLSYAPIVKWSMKQRKVSPNT